MGHKHLIWNFQKVDRETWDKYWTKVQFSNLMQCWEYGEVKRCQGWQAVRFLVLNEKNIPFGLLQVLFKGVNLLGGIARINRGPLFFKDPFNSLPDTQHVNTLLLSIRRLAKVQRWWYLSIAPELPVDDRYSSELHKVGFKKKEKKAAWGSTRLSLKPAREDLLMGLKGKWRNLLRKGEKLGIMVEEVTCDKQVSSLIECYAEFKKIRKFVGVPSKLLVELYGQSGANFSFKIYQTFGVTGKDVSAFVFVIHHGDTATYLVGWSSEEGRRMQANYLLLWRGIEEAKAAGLQWFDMGGLNQNTTKGIAHFKTGVNGDPYQLIGEF
jgi:lipid II:glycine glycyltransferase (peptidoglycan interpeptide bridge formation enzyme)